MDQVVDLDSLATWAKVIAKKIALFRRVIPMAMENLSIAQHRDTLRYAHTWADNYKPKVWQFDVGDFVYLQRQLNGILDTSFSHTILRIKVIKPSGVLELQGVNGHIIPDHSKNCAPCNLLNLNPTIVTSIWIPPLDYPCQVCQRTNDVDQMLFCDNCNGGYHLFYFKSELTSSCRHLVLFIMFSCSTLISTQTMPHFSWLKSRGIHENFILTSFCALYIYVCASLFGGLVFAFDWF
jgi:hypothetical protein